MAVRGDSGVYWLRTKGPGLMDSSKGWIKI